MSAIHLREATHGDLDLLRSWQRQPHVVAAGAGDDWQWETELSRKPGWREQLIAEVDGRAVGFIQIIDPAREESHYWGDVEANLRAIDIWLGDVRDLGRGYGSEMMRQALRRCFASAAVEAVLVDPLRRNTRAQRFYRRHGFEPLVDRRFGADDCRVFRLPRAAWESRAGPQPSS